VIMIAVRVIMALVVMAGMIMRRRCGCRRRRRCGLRSAGRAC